MAKIEWTWWNRMTTLTKTMNPSLFMRSAQDEPQVDFRINGITVRAMIDSGAQVNLIDQATYELLATVPRLSATSKRLFAYQANNLLRVRGQFIASGEANGHITKTEFKVVDGQSRNEWKSKSPAWTTRRSGLRGNNEYDMTVYQSHIEKTRKQTARDSLFGSTWPTKI